MTVSETDFPALQELIPHRGEALLLERVLRHDGQSSEARVVVGSHRWLRREDGSVAMWLSVEYMAQCAAMHEGILARNEGRPMPEGFLVAARKLAMHRSQFEPGQQLRISARRLRGRHGLGALAYECSVHADGDPEGVQGRPGIRAGSERERDSLLAEGRLTVALSAVHSSANDRIDPIDRT
jgi:predicted hotdog family 3-hydroxylacyl-ACP dehydratase